MGVSNADPLSAQYELDGCHGPQLVVRQVKTGGHRIELRFGVPERWSSMRINCKRTAIYSKSNQE